MYRLASSPSQNYRTTLRIILRHIQVGSQSEGQQKLKLDSPSEIPQTVVSSADNTGIPAFLELEQLRQRHTDPSWPYFILPQPKLGNRFTEDVPLNNYLKRIVPKEVLEEWTPDLERFGQRMSDQGDIPALHRQCEEQPPRLVPMDAWGKWSNTLETCQAWKNMHAIAAQEGLIAIAYERKYGQWSRLYQMVKNYLFAPTSGLYSCPLAMTDGAARITQQLKDSTQKDMPRQLISDVFRRLTCRDPEEFWTSGQWMTERKGGSDVANGTETIAVPVTDDGRDASCYQLFGYKWFSSATDADVALTLARIADPDGNTIPGSHGLSLFLLKTREHDTLNNIHMVKLKNKLGTRQLPTAELLLHGTRAHLISPPGRGVAGISTMLILTRIHNAVSAVAAMRKIVHLARNYAEQRTAFGRRLIQHPLHMRTLARLELSVRGNLLMLLETVRLLGREETGQATETEQGLLRILTPLLKLYTAKQAVAVASEGLECFGGQGYIEDTGLPSILRDAQVLPIWEGTTNILSLDVLRSMAKSKGATLKILLEDCLKRIEHSGNKGAYAIISQCVGKLGYIAERVAQDGADIQQLAARDVALALSELYIGSLLVEHASQTKDAMDSVAAQRWLNQIVSPLMKKLDIISEEYTEKGITNDFSLVMSKPL